jgi:itaconate CoA-transferase
MHETRKRSKALLTLILSLSRTVGSSWQRTADRGDLRLYYYESARIAGDTVLRYELNDRILPYCMFITGVERALIKRGMEDGGLKVVYYVPSNFHQAVRLLTEEIGIDTFVCTVSPLLQLPARGRAPEDEAIGRIIAGLVPDGACLQMSVGALPNLVCAALQDRNDQGIHTEALNPGLIDLVGAGVVTNRRKALDRGMTVFAFAMGQKALYDFIDSNPAIESRPVDYVNDPRIITQNDNVISINATLQIDLTGACNSEHMLGHQYSASGGQLDFVRGAFASKGGKSIIAARSTAAKGKVSRIVAMLDGPVTTPRIDTHYVVTEFGAANLKGLSSTERAHALIALAHPASRDELTQAAKQLHLV